MDISARKEEFSRAYIKSIAAQVGLKHFTGSVDDESIDLIFRGSGYSGAVRNPQIDIQLKCTSQKILQDDVIKYPLKIKNYNDLRDKDVAAPRYLMILIVPDDISLWIRHNNDSLILSNTCYWVSLRFRPETTKSCKHHSRNPNETKSNTSISG